MLRKIVAPVVLALAVGGSFAYFLSNSSRSTIATSVTRAQRPAHPKGRSRPTTTTTTSTTQPQAQTISGVGELQVPVVEPGRLMCPPGFPCAERTYTLQVYYPSTTVTGGTPVASAPLARPINPYPVIVFGEGFNVMPATYLPLLTAWVSAGYVVASPIFPLTSAEGLAHYGVNLNNVELADHYEDDLTNEPGDLSAAITEMATLASTSTSPLSGEIDPNDVAVAGQSDGADAALALAANTCCVDSRVKAALVLSGAEFPGYQGQYFSTPAIPLLVTQGSADTVNAPYLSSQIYSLAPAPKAYLTLIGADHLAPYTALDPYESVVAKVTTDFLNGYLKGSQTSLGQMTADGTVSGVAQLVSDLSSSG